VTSTGAQPITPAVMRVGMTVVRDHGKSQWDGVHVTITRVQRKVDPLGRIRVTGKSPAGDEFLARLVADDATWSLLSRDQEGD
jgi:hypothetical protein